MRCVQGRGNEGEKAGTGTAGMLLQGWPWGIYGGLPGMFLQELMWEWEGSGGTVVGTASAWGWWRTSCEPQTQSPTLSSNLSASSLSHSFITKKEREVCANPSDPWVQRYLQSVKRD